MERAIDADQNVSYHITMTHTSDDLIDLSAYPLLLALPQVAEILGCSLPSAKRRIYSGDLAYIKEGHNVRVPREALRRYLVAHLIPAKEISG